jgi:hypothetical protein
MGSEAGGGVPEVADLREAERRLWAAFGRGESVDLRVGDPGSDDPMHGHTWAESRHVRAEVIATLLLGAVPPTAGYVPGVSLVGARIIGDLDLGRGVVGCAALLRGCRFDGVLRLSEAAMRTVDLADSVLDFLDAPAVTIAGDLIADGCRVKAISLYAASISGRLSLNGAHVGGLGRTALFADRATVASGLFCRFGFNAEGECRLIDAQISGGLDMTGAHITNPGHIALRADRIRLEGSLVCGGGFTANGKIALGGANIRGQVVFNGAHLINPEQTALDAGSITADDGLFFGEGFKADGEIRLLHAHTRGSVSFDGAHLVNPGKIALHADRLTADNGLFCDQGFRAEGQIRLVVARIGGQLAFNSAHLSNNVDDALTASGLTVDGSMLCEDGFRVDGKITLRGAKISGVLGLRDAIITNPDKLALDLTRFQADLLRLNDAVVTGIVDLTSAHVRAVHDDPQHWPSRTLFDGLVYEDLQPYAPASGHSGRLAWLNCDEPGYRAQPYEQLAGYYRRLGHDEEARRVLVAKQRRRRTGSRLPSKLVSYALDVIVGYGYRPGRALGWLVLLLTVGSVYFAVNRPAPIDPSHHPHYQPILYTADLVIPVVNLGQAGAWNPTGGAQWVAATLTACGWILATAVIAGVTRVLARA